MPPESCAQDFLIPIEETEEPPMKTGAPIVRDYRALNDTVSEVTRLSDLYFKVYSGSPPNIRTRR